ncbi:MAG: Bug family tripartite tricarboxylate transporter substrate binding protein [Alphaproteobacteria bacterium]
MLDTLKSRGTLKACGVAIGLLAATPAAAQDQFFAGKTVDFYIGYEAGAGYDIYARLFGEHIVRFLPGNPTVIPRNMPGAASMRAMTYLHQAGKKDGTAWGAIDRNVAVEPLLYGADSKAPFKDPLEFNWIGSLNTEIGVAAVWHTTGIKSWEDTLRRPTIVAMAGAQGGIGARVLNSLLDTKFQQVCCYGSDGNQNLAMERGEVEGRVGASWSTFKVSAAKWLETGQVKLIMQVGLEKNPDIPGDVPLVMDLARNDKERAAMKIVFSNQSMGRPYVMPPGVPAARVAEVRRAFNAMIKDPAFLADAEKRRLEINNPKTGEQIDEILRDVYSSPEEAITAARLSIKQGEYKMKDEPKK